MSPAKPAVMDKQTKLELLQRALGLRHKIKVHDSMPMPDTHEDIALSSWARMELEDELHAIEEILREARAAAVSEKKTTILKQGVKKKAKV